MTVSTMFELAGLIGVILYVGAYAALQLGFLRGNGYSYALANLLASALVLVSLLTSFNLSSAIIQMMWVVISTAGLARMYWLDRSARLDKEEQAFIARKFPLMPPSNARAFLSAGQWREAEAGILLATEGERLGALIYLASGKAEVLSGNRVVGHCEANNFIGEMSCFDGSAASATVILTSDARYFSISTEALARLCTRDFEMRQTLHHAVGADMRSKLIATTRRLGDDAS